MIEISSPTRRAMIKTGTYTGDGNDNRTINIGIDLTAKSNVLLIIKRSGPSGPMFRIEYGQGDLSMHFGASSDDANCIQAFVSTGFQIGTADEVNDDGSLYRYIAFWQES